MIRDAAAKIVADALAAEEPENRARMAREIMAHAAAGIVFTDGQLSAVRACRNLARAVASREAVACK